MSAVKKLDSPQGQTWTSSLSDWPDLLTRTHVTAKRLFATETWGKSDRTVPILEQMWKVTSHEEWVNHVVPAKALHDSLDWVGLKVVGGRTGQIKGQKGET